ncbi:hypothetical protein T484DRAFT_1822370, partial [Baffinella frigidus]
MLELLCREAAVLPDRAWAVSGVAQVVHALVRLRYPDKALLQRLVLISLQLPPRALNSQAVSLLLNALFVFAHLRLDSRLLLTVLLSRVRSFRPPDLPVRSIIISLNAVARLPDMSPRTSAPVIQHLAATLRMHPHSAFTPREAAAVATALLRAGVLDRALLLHLAAVVSSFSPPELAGVPGPSPSPVTATRPLPTDDLSQGSGGGGGGGGVGGGGSVAMLHPVASLMSTFSTFGFLGTDPVFGALVAALLL